jgi:hypothetical protein
MEIKFSYELHYIVGNGIKKECSAEMSEMKEKYVNK